MLLQAAWASGISPSDQEGAGSLGELQDNLKPGWTVHVTHDNRLYYCNHLTQTASWLPPADAWARDNSGGFPFGWEEAIDSDGKSYYINHVNKTTSYEDPRTDWTEEPPQPRTVELTRHPLLGFGFVAGSERPVIVRFVTENGPSVGKLQPGDQLLTINDEDVRTAPRDHVIQLVRGCKDTVRLVVCQPPLDNSTRKSALLSSAKKAKLKSNPSRVRFAEGVVVNGSPLYTASAFSGGEGGVPLMPNVLKVFLENGQTKSFKYDSTTRVGDVVASLQQKLCLKAIHHFSLVLEQVKSLRRNKLTLLNPEHTLARIASRPGSHNLRCLFRVTFVPRDACDLAQKDLAAFEYLYLQCCNDVVQERYAPELKYDIALRLAALHIHQHAISNNIPPSKITVKSIEREFGLERFVPVSLMESMKRKELRKLLSHLLKLNQTMTGTSHKCLTSLQAKLYYLSIISELPSYGAKCFSTNIRDCNMETVILVSPKLGISQINGIRNSMPVPLADIEQLTLIRVQREDQISSLVTIYLPTAIQKEVSVSMEDRDADELVLVLQGYYRLLTGKQLTLEQEKDVWTQDQAPLYHSQHAVRPARWSYAVDSEEERYANFAVSPPYHPVSHTRHMRSNGSMTLTRSHSDVMQPSNNTVDNNMNNTLPSKFKDRNGYCGIGYKPNSLPGAPHHKLGIDLQSVVSMEILESDNGFVEARNEEVLRRVAEMQELVVNSEQYLTQHQRETSDSESSHISSQDSDNPGQLKHSDSLLLLTQGLQQVPDSLSEAVQSLDLGETESDTDSISTPSSSPSHRNPSGKDRNRDSDSSFGLHSPDSLVPGAGQQALQELWRRLQEETAHLGYEMTGGSLYLDPDIIDLTLIPPPITPEKEGVGYALPPEISMPPMPFADHSLNLDSSTLGLESKDVLNLDLDSFLATVTVPPPQRTSSTLELTSEQINSFIIPPPPPVPPASDIEVEPPLPPPHLERPNGYVPNGLDTDRPIERRASTGSRNVAFSCCSKPRQQSPDNCPLSLPPRVGSVGSASPPGRPPKPPNLPPRSDSISGGTLTRKPPLPPVPSQDVSFMNGYLSVSREACVMVSGLCERLGQVAAQCNADQAHGGGASIDEGRFQEAKEALTLEVRKLVTSSKLLVRSSSTANPSNSPSPDFQTHLANCLTLLRRLTELSGKMAAHTSSPLHTRNLVLKVQDVVAVFTDLLATEGQEAQLTKQAENLASVLATLLRSLRVFTP
uniref:FERM and PDZ domain-containing protein 4 n=1 Tax=Graphocephala atropunctata TaxID=36148 RepID=A0A1B6M6W8_9HEMI